MKDIKKTRPLRVLSAADWQHWISKGYVIVRQAVPQDQVDAVVEMLWQFQEMDPNDDSTWYKPQLRDHKMKELNNTGMVEVYNHPSMWATRQHPRVYDAFVDIWDREDLWVAVDRANLNPPNKGARAAGKINGFVHFDVDVSQRPLPVAVQGVLSLKKTGRRDRRLSMPAQHFLPKLKTGGASSRRARTRLHPTSPAMSWSIQKWNPATY